MKISPWAFFFFTTVAFLAWQSCSSDSNEIAQEPEELVIRDSVVCYSLMGQPLKYPTETRSSFDRKDSLLQIAQTNYMSDPGDLENIIWYGRRLAYLSEFREAMSIYTRGLHIHPKSPEIYRHRGHRYISTRRFEEAVNDLVLASELSRGREVQIEPDGLPNKLDIPLSSLQFNIWYHLGLAQYLQANYEDALRAYDSCMVYSINPDLLVATSYWMYLTKLRLNDQTGAQALLSSVDSDLEIIENDGYLELLRLYKGELTPEQVLGASTAEEDLQNVTKAYGVANYYLSQGNTDQAKSVLEKVLKNPTWAAFGYIAAEADIARGL